MKLIGSSTATDNLLSNQLFTQRLTTAENIASLTGKNGPNSKVKVTQ